MPRNVSLFFVIAAVLVWAGVIIGTNVAQAADSAQIAPTPNASFDCHIPDLKLPPKFKVYAASTHDSGSPLPLKLNESEGEARLVEVLLNSPDEPVALMLGAFDPTIWHFNWTEGTKIVAVVVSGLDASYLMGLPDDVPILDTYDSPHKTCPRMFSVRSGDEFKKTNEFARHLFNQGIDLDIRIQDSQVAFGQPLSDNNKLLTEAEFSLEKFTNPDKPLTYKVALEEAERKGLIRKAVKEDVQSYLKALAQGAGLPPHMIDEGLRLSAYETYWQNDDRKLYDSYVVLSNKFQFPTNLYPLRDVVRYILPEGISRPEVRPKKSEIFSMAEAKSPGDSREVVRWGCGQTGLRLPSNVKVYAGSNFVGSPVDFLSGDKYNQAELVPVVINSPNEPVALILQNHNYWPVIWHFQWTEGTKIAAVFTDDRITGLPSETPILKVRDCQIFQNKQAAAPRLQFPTSINSPGSVAKLAIINELSRQLFKKDVGQLYFSGSGRSVIGEPLKENMKLLTAEELKTKNLINPDAPWGGASSMTQDILQGKIRRATVADMWSRAAAEASEAGLPEHIINKITLYNRTRIDGHSRPYQEASPIPNTYMVLSPDFVIPDKLYQAEFKPIKSFHYDIRDASASFLYSDGSRIKCSYRPSETKNTGVPLVKNTNVKPKPCDKTDCQLPANMKLGYMSSPIDVDYEILSPNSSGRPRDNMGTFFEFSANYNLPDGSWTTCSYKSHDEIVSKIKPKPISGDCGLPDFKPPANLKVYAVGANPSAGSPLNIPLYNKDRMDVGLARLTINSPREPVALMLDGSNPTIWHLNWTKGTTIAAVVFNNGFYDQRISGLPEGVPVMHTGEACPKFSVSPRGRFILGGEIGSTTGLNALSNHLFQTDVEELYEVRDGRAFIGQAPLEEMSLETAKEFNEEEFISPDMPPAGLSSITYAVGKGLIRKADEADYHQWLSKHYRNIRNVPENKIEEAIKNGYNQSGAPPKFRNVYVILSDDYLVPPKLPESYKRPEMEIDFIVPEDISLRPDQSWNFSTFYMLKDGTCQGREVSSKCTAK